MLTDGRRRSHVWSKWKLAHLVNTAATLRFLKLFIRLLSVSTHTHTHTHTLFLYTVSMYWFEVTGALWGIVSYNFSFAVFTFDDAVSIAVDWHLWNGREPWQMYENKAHLPLQTLSNVNWGCVTVAGEVAKSNIILLHEGLWADQIWQRPVHIQILRVERTTF